MPKSEGKSIKVTDVKEYLGNYSDFAFELRVLKKIKKLGLSCEHAGTYRDPVTNITREFDIRASHQKRHSSLLLAIECKNLSSDHPLIVHCLHRSQKESYQQYIRGVARTKEYLEIFEAPVDIKQFSGNDCVYPTQELVGKSTDQIYRKDGSGELRTGDSDVFHKISQAINSSFELVELAYNTHPGMNYCIWPILIVPDKTLWAVRYDDNGNVIGDPKQSDKLPYFIGKVWTVEGAHPVQPVKYTISHLDIVTFSALEEFVSEVLFNERTVLRFG